ncbi:MAG: DUF1109 domain-containing protein [Proteobacteria bacterium]|nr:DUF1109 domain-containing protein [Pseudomonadota bacterium]
MTKTLDLITKLSSEAKPAKPLPKPASWILFLLAELFFYAVILQTFLGLRPDLAVELTHPLFVVEITLTLLLFVSSITATVLTMYPDLYQKSFLLKIPYLIFFLLLGFFLAEFFIFYDVENIFSSENFHGLQCALCIVISSSVPAAFIFAILRRGASVLPKQSGFFTILAASSLSYFVTRLDEVNDSVIHLFIWHYLPILFFALLGALLGKWLLKW